MSFQVSYDKKTRCINGSLELYRINETVFTISDIYGLYQQRNLFVYYPNRYIVSIVSFGNTGVYETLLMDINETHIYDGRFGYYNVKKFRSMEMLIEELYKIYHCIVREKRRESKKAQKKRRRQEQEMLREKRRNVRRWQKEWQRQKRLAQSKCDD
jgi:hypothetical protein